MNTIAIYTRVSSKSQDAASQDADLKRWADSNLDVLRGDVKVKKFTDKFTGKSMERPGFEAMMAGVKAGTIKTIVIWRLDRLGRTATGLTKLFEELIALKVNLVSIKDGLDLSTPAGRLMANVLASVAQFETEVRSERQMAGIAVAKAEGVKFGRPATGVGTGKRVKVTPEQEATILRMNAEGASKVAMASATGLSRPTIYSILATA
jgi:DNA invertase Pin-like site-specific DNA recombinase